METVGLTGIETLGNAIVDLASVQASAVIASVEDQRLQGWLTERAAAGFRATQMPGADHYQTLLTVLLSALAAEALVNRLLEPLLSADEWSKMERDLGTPEKWMRLYDRLRLTPKAGSMQKLRALFKLRNDLVHLKHSTTLIRKETPVPLKWALRPKGEPPKAPAEVTADPKLRERLEPRCAADYYGCVRDLLVGVLESYPRDPFKVDEHLRQLLRESVQQPEQLRPVGLGHREREFVDAVMAAIARLVEVLNALLPPPPNQKTLADKMACGFLLRTRSLLYGMYLLSTTGQGLEAAALASALVDLAVVASWVGSDADRAARLEASSFVAEKTLADAVAAEHGFAWSKASMEVLDENQKRLDERVRAHGRRAVEVPSRQEMAEQCGLGELLGVSGEWLRWMRETDARSLVVEVLGQSTKELFVVLYDGGQAAVAAVEAATRVLGLRDRAREALEQFRGCLQRAERAVDEARGGARKH